MSEQEKKATPQKEKEEEEMVTSDAEADDAQDEEESSRKELVNQIMKDPSVLASLQQKLHKFLGHPSGYIQSLPTVMKNRLKALKKLQLEFTDLEADFYKEVHNLEVKYDKMHQKLYEKRSKIVNAEYEPTKEECEFELDDEEEAEDQNLCEDMKEKAKVEEENEPLHEFNEDTKGIPEFWLTIFKNVDLLAEMLQDYDEPVLQSLKDIKIVFSEEPMAFTLEFIFAENEFFTNEKLTKYYEMKCKPDPEDPFKFEGPEIIRCKGCTIDWKQDMNVTQKVVKKKQKHKTRGAVRTITKTVARDSFFNFFSPPPVPDELGEVMDEELQALLTADFEIGHYIRERVVPRAVLYFTGEALDDDDFEEEEDDGEDEDCEEEDDPDYDPSKDKDGAKQECKQQ